MVKATLKLKDPEKHKEATFRLGLPTGQPMLFQFNKSNDWTLDIPTEIHYKDSLRKDQVLEAKGEPLNYAQFLLDSFPDLLELVEVKAPEPTVQPTVTKRKRKETKDETV